MMKLSALLKEAEEESSIKTLKGEKCTIVYQVFPNHWDLCSIRTSTKALNQGFATKLLTQFLEMAKQANMPVHLLASPLTRRTSLNRLVNFYKKFGFELTGRAGNPMGDPIMIKNP